MESEAVLSQATLVLGYGPATVRVELLKVEVLVAAPVALQCRLHDARLAGAADIAVSS